METALTVRQARQPILAEAISPRVAEYAHRTGATCEIMDLDHAPRANKPSVYAEVCANVEAMLRIDELVAGGMGMVQARKHVSALFCDWPGMSLGRLNGKHGIWLHGGRKPGTDGKPTGEFFASHDWHAFVPTYNNGDIEAMLNNGPFCDHLAFMVGSRTRQGVGAAVRRELLEEWMRRVEIPGVGNIVRWCAIQAPPLAVPKIGTAPHPKFFPAGWSKTNIQRCIDKVLGPRGSAKTVFMQRGEHAALSFWGDQLYRTRANLRPLELVTADDVDLDVLCWMPLGDGTVQIVRPRVFFILDVSCAYILNFGAVGAYTRNFYMDGGDKDTKRSLQATDFKDLMLGTLEMYGLPQNWPMHNLHENATTKLSETDERMFERFLNIKFGHTEMMHTKLAGGFLEVCGNPKQKGWQESFFNPLQNLLCGLPAALGPRYDQGRGDTGVALWKKGKQVASRKGSLVHEALNIIRNAQAVARQQGRDVAELLDYGARREGTFDMPLLRFDQLMAIIAETVDLMNARTEHNLEGFDQVIDVEVAPGQFVPSTHPAALHVAREGLRCRTRMESPAERFARLSYGQPFRKLHPRELSVLAREIKPVTVTNEQVTVSGQRYGLDKMIFRDAASAAALARYNGQKKALVYFLGHDARQIHLFTNDDAMQWVASPARVDLVDPMDKIEAGRRMGEVARGRQAIRDDAERIMASRTAEITAMREHNASVLDSYNPANRVASQIETVEAEHRASDAKRTAMSGKMRKQLEAKAAALALPDESDEPTRPSYGLNRNVLLNP